MLEGDYKLLRDSAVPFIMAELHPFALEKMEHSQETLHTYMKKIAILAISSLSGGGSADFRPGTSHG